jgi:hypothetical protein
MLVGSGRTYRGEGVTNIVHDLGIEDLVEFQDSIPFDACQALLRRSHGLLLLAMDQPAQVPNKLFDYLAARRPILAFVDSGGECHRLLETLSGHQVVTDRLQASADAALEALIAANLEGMPLADPEGALSRLLWTSQFPKVAGLVEDIVHRDVSDSAALPARVAPSAAVPRENPNPTKDGSMERSRLEMPPWGQALVRR